MDVVRARKRANTSHKSEKCTADDIRENAKPQLRVEMNVRKKKIEKTVFVPARSYRSL